MKHILNRVIASLFLPVLVLAVAGSAPATAGSAPDVAKPLKIRFTLAWLAQSTHGPCFLALVVGYYQAVGLAGPLDWGRAPPCAVRPTLGGAAAG